MTMSSTALQRGLALVSIAWLSAGLVAGNAEAASLQFARGGDSIATGGVVLVQVPPGGKSVPKHQGTESYGGSKLPRPKSGAERPFQHNGVTTTYNKGIDKPQLKGNERPFQHNGVTTSYNKSAGQPKGGTKLPFDHNTMTSGAGNKKPR